MSGYLIIVLGLLTVFTICGIRRQRLLNPLFVFNGIWLICFILYSLNLSSFYTNDMSGKAFLVIVSMILSFNCLYFFGLHIRHTKVKLSLKLLKCDNKYLYIKRLFFIWLMLTVMEAIYCHNMPLIWLILGRSGNYATFGIPSLHGFINSLSWFVLNIGFIYYLNTRDNRIIKYLLIINLIYILLLARQSITTEAVQLIAIYTLKRRVKIKRLIILVLLGIVGFGVIGNIRTNPMHILATSGLGYESVSFFLMGFVWVFLYLMTPIANIINLINNFEGFMYGVASLNKFLPTVVADALNLPGIDTEKYLVRQTYNVSTSLVQPYADFGILGIIIFFCFLGILGSKYWSNLNKNNFDDMDVCNYSIYLGILSLTFFSNMLLSLPIVMQFVYTNVLFRNYFEHPVEDKVISTGEFKNVQKI